MLKNLFKKANTFIKEEKGDFSVKGIAITVAVIVIIGVAVGLIRGFASDWITQIWNMLIDFIDETLM
jgi:large-conductance mechanosensitive channel